MVPLIWLSRHDNIDAFGPWDTGILQHMFGGSLWPHTIEFDTTNKNSRSIPDHFFGEVGVVVLPARHHYRDVEWLNTELAKLKGVILILSSDEDADFPWREIRHPNLKLWVQSPHNGRYSDCQWAYRFGYGWRVEFPMWAKAAHKWTGHRGHLWSFTGQVTNEARRRAMSGLRRARAQVPGYLVETEGFAQGLEPYEYARELGDTWVVPCPAGPKTVDTFRLYEALELGCIPFVDSSMPDGSMVRYWYDTFGTNPLRQVDNWTDAGEVIEKLLEDRTRTSAVMSAWWQQTKRQMVKRLEADLIALGVEVEPWAKTTILVTTSPVPSNPSLDMILDTIGSIPDSNTELIIAMDGIRPEQEHMTRDYNEFCYRVAMWCEHTGHAAIPVIADEWLHQMGLTKLAVGYIDTPTVLFMEHDTPMLKDRYTDWNGIVELAEQNHLDVIRFHHEELILEVHERMMVDHQTVEMLGVPLRRTRQWSQRPAVYNTAYLRRILVENFTPRARCFIEDRMHSFAQHQSGHRLAIYHPEPGGIRRSGHSDGRAGGPKYDDTQIF